MSKGCIYQLPTAIKGIYDDDEPMMPNLLQQQLDWAKRQTHGVMMSLPSHQTLR